MRLDRRTVLTGAGSSLIAVLAGCQGSTERPPNETTTTTDSSATETTTVAATEETTTADPAALERRAREFVALIDDGAYERAHEQFSPATAEQITPGDLEQVWTGLEEQNGDFLSVSGMETTAQADYDVVTGVLNFERGQQEFVVAFGTDGIAGFRIRPPQEAWSPPSYADESAFTERDISIAATDDCSLGGTLTVPKNADGAPGVVIVHGQGPSDRDGTVGPNRPYKDLAWGLASRGVAVLRYDKRTQACDVNLAEVTIDEAVTDDALSAVETLRETDAVAADDVVVAGHSIGGTLAPRIAARDGNLAGIVMLAALARPVTEAMLDQNEYLVERDGTVTDAERRQLSRVRDIVDRIRSLDFPDDEVVYLGGDEYWRTLTEYDAVATAKGVDTSQLVLQGERDYQVTVEEDFAQWRDALGDRSNVAFERYPKLNHFFMPGTGKPGNQEYFQRNHVAEQVVTDVASFAEDATNGANTTTDAAIRTRRTSEP